MKTVLYRTAEFRQACEQLLTEREEKLGQLAQLLQELGSQLVEVEAEIKWIEKCNGDLTSALQLGTVPISVDAREEVG